MWKRLIEIKIGREKESVYINGSGIKNQSVEDERGWRDEEIEW